MNPIKLPVFFLLVCCAWATLLLFGKQCFAGKIQTEPMVIVDHDSPRSSPIFNLENNSFLLTVSSGLSGALLLEHDIRNGNLLKKTAIDAQFGSSVYLPRSSNKIIVSENEKVHIYSIQPNGTVSEKSIAVPFASSSYYSLIMSPLGSYSVLSSMYQPGVFTINIDDTADLEHLPDTLIIKKHPWSQAPFPLAVSEEKIVILTGNEEFVGYDSLNKKQLWRKKCEAGESYSFARFSADNRYLISAKSSIEHSLFIVFMLDVQTGKLVWQHEIESLIGFDLSANGETVLLFAKKGRVEICHPEQKNNNQIITVSGIIKSGAISQDSTTIAITTEANNRYQTSIFSSEVHKDI